MMKGFSEEDHFWMKQAIGLAEKARDAKEVPVGAVLVLDDRMLGEGSNRTIRDCDPSAHAEIVALRNGAKHCNNYRLVGATLYVTLEPCVMCVGAIVQARLKRVVYGAFDARFGAVESALQLGVSDKFNHCSIYEGGLLENDCASLLSAFFKVLRKHC